VYLRSFAVAACVALAASPGEAQLTQASAPAENYLVWITQEWAAASPLGSLANRALPRGDVELRVWGGYGLTSTTGVILRRSAGRWRAWRAEVVPCTYAVPIPIGDTASPATESLFVRRAHDRCGASLDSTAYGETVYQADTLAVVEVPALGAEAAWRRAVAAGVRALPPKVPRSWIMTDGFTYVIELREGGRYRASAIEALDKPEADADRQAAAIFRAVNEGLPPVRRHER
jgi:hypothetical protein